MKPVLAACALAALAACSPKLEAPKPVSEAAAPAAKPASAAGLPAGAYTLDKAHSSLIFRADHMGFAKFTGRFTTFDARLQLDPAKPETAVLAVDIDPASLNADNPPAGFLAKLTGPGWVDAKKHPRMTFRSTRVAMTGPDTADIDGNLTLNGLTKPVVVKAKFNGGYAGNPYDPQARIGFSATATLNRSDFAVSQGLPPPGSNMGVFDPIEIVIETEFNGPPWKAPA